MDARGTRALRGAAAASTAALIAATAHTLAGGGPPPALLVLVVVALATPPAVALVGRRPSLWRTAAAVIVSQLLFHVAFAVAGSATGTAAGIARGGHTHLVVPAVLPGATTAMPAHLLPDAPMLLAHVAAAVLTTVLVAHGERLLRALGAGIRSLLPALRAVAPLNAHLPRRAFALPDATVVTVFPWDVPRRGPPLH